MGRLDVSYAPRAKAPTGGLLIIGEAVLAGTLRRALSEEPEQVLLLYDTLKQVVREAGSNLEGS